MKPRIIFGLIFGLLGILLSNYALETLGECSPVLIVILAGGAGLLTGLSENVQARVDVSKAGAIAGAITGVLTFVGQFVLMALTANPQAYSSNNILNTFFITIIYTLFVLSLSVLPAVGIGAVAALIAAKYRLALIAGVIAAVLTYFMMPILAQYSLFNNWRAIDSPPSGAARILGATDGTFKEYDDVWIETQDGHIFSASVCTGYSQPCSEDHQWKSISNTPEYFSQYTGGTDCKKLEDYPLNPCGQIVECRHYLFVENDLSTIMYYALMADGSLNYFVMDFRMQLEVLFKFILTTVLIFFVMLIFVFRLTNYLAWQIQI